MFQELKVGRVWIEGVRGGERSQAAQGTAQRALVLGAMRNDGRCAAEAPGEQICA